MGEESRRRMPDWLATERDQSRTWMLTRFETAIMALTIVLGAIVGGIAGTVIAQHVAHR